MKVRIAALLSCLFDIDKIVLSRDQKLIQSYLDEVLLLNKTINVTRIIDEEQARLLHIEDSLAGLHELNEAPEGAYADLGSGGGFPGVPLAIATGRKTLLVDSVKKKMFAIQRIIDKLDLGQLIETYGGRIEDLSIERPNEFTVLTARALSSLPSLLELASPLLKEQGHLICYKAPLEEEFEKSLRIQDKLGFRMISKREFVLTDGETKRCILVFEKIHEPSLKLPRRVGLAQKKPLIS